METKVYSERAQRGSPLRLSTLARTDFSNNYLLRRNLILFLLIFYPIITRSVISQAVGQISDRDHVTIAYAAILFPYILLSGFYLSKIVLHKDNILAISSLLVFLATFSGLIIGFLNGWQIRDIIGDTVRFIAPFLSFALFSLLFNNLTAKALGRIFVFLIYLSTFDMLSGLLGRLGDLFFGEATLFKYAGGGLGSSTVLTVVTLFVLYKHLSTSWRCIAFLSLLLLGISPLLSMSRNGILSSITMFLVMFIFGLVKRQYVLLLAAPIITFALIFKEMFFWRITNMYNALSFGINNSIVGSSTGTSASGRMSEIKAALEGLQSSATNWIFGLGHGALWYSDNAILGISPNNYRLDGGVHHIHSGFMALIFRNGLFGLGIYSGLIFLIIVVAYRNYLYFKSSELVVSAISAGLFTSTIVGFVAMGPLISLYGSVSLGLTAAWVFRLRKIRMLRC